MLSVDVRIVSDKDDLLAVNLYDKPGWKAVPELPSERNSPSLEVIFVYFAGYGMLSRLGVGADSPLYNLIVDDDLTVIAIQGNAFSRLVFCRDNKVISAERHGALGRTSARVELAYGMLCKPDQIVARVPCGV